MLLMEKNGWKNLKYGREDMCFGVLGLGMITVIRDE
jgi:hypothetical protein